jgi:predicted Na+-dependent transporter
MHAAEQSLGSLIHRSRFHSSGCVRRFQRCRRALDLVSTAAAVPLLLILIVAYILAIVLLGIKLASAALGFGKGDNIAATFCGWQKSLVNGVPTASTLFSPAAMGPVLIPIMIH